VRVRKGSVVLTFGLLLFDWYGSLVTGAKFGQGHLKPEDELSVGGKEVSWSSFFQESLPPSNSYFPSPTAVSIFTLFVISDRGKFSASSAI